MHDSKQLQEQIIRNLGSYGDFPKPGVVFKDIGQILANPTLFQEIINQMALIIAEYRIQKIVAVESRGFIFAAPLAYKAGIPFVLARKKGKLPGEVFLAEYSLEYGTDFLAMQKHALITGERVAIVDDVLATGGTISAVGNLVQLAGAKTELSLFLLQLNFLLGKNKLLGLYPKMDIVSLASIS